MPYLAKLAARLSTRVRAVRAVSYVVAPPMGLAAALLVAAGCSDAGAPTGVSAPLEKRSGYHVVASSLAAATATTTSTTSATGTSVVGVPMAAVLRAKPLTNTLVVSAEIGPAGGTIELKEAGFTLTVPKGVGAVNTTFQVKALPGRILAYEFEPHGTRFPVPLGFSQDTKAIDPASAAGIVVPMLGYFASAAQLDHGAGGAAVTELQPAFTITDATGKKVTGSIWHFSGYMVSSGRTYAR